jgi:D-serine deaminase-like pyridoxal phosphate-dependent protein
MSTPTPGAGTGHEMNASSTGCDPRGVLTPCLVVDHDVRNGNIGRMAALADRLGMRLRPHAKTHKCLQIARLQRAAGAAGLTVATVGEAEVFVEAGFDEPPESRPR